MTYRVKNWRQFQHYSDRNPPWIKLHFAMLSSSDWVMLDDASRVLAIACMLIASRNDGEVPDNPDYIKRVAYLNKTPNFKPLIDCGFLECASGCKQMLATARPETETETETETEPRAKNARRPIPKDFAISAATREWAGGKGWEPYLDAHLDYFRDYAASSGKTYADWEAAFRNCIKGDWGGVRKNFKANGKDEKRFVI